MAVALNERGLRCGVLMGPVVPFLSDSPAQFDAAADVVFRAGRNDFVEPDRLGRSRGYRDEGRARGENGKADGHACLLSPGGRIQA